MKYRYYLPLRPVSLGTQPNGFTEYKNFDGRQFCPEIGHEAWGYVEYDKALSEKQMKEYDLIQMPTSSAQNFRTFREQYGSRTQFAKLTGLKPRLFEVYEQGLRDPKHMSADVLCKIANAVGMTMDEVYRQF